ncbi:hypothetical protein GN244_ATG00343 [Phytophthora infestans]|uniref:Uncharacterized protein n=1 Tax=Phytophthora infestans TaxID=4787 RepID=A0A833WQR2_PHYIN|nr:hypothetical protein GN244_ATG00343 [Phytophthora infestans]KAF4139516.1 hypothetical protein GN958_ATG11417 [Phytophthora infestans]
MMVSVIQEQAIKGSLRLTFKPIRGVYYHQQVLELVDFVLEGVLGAMVSQTLMNATQMLLREEEASVVLDMIIEKPTLVLPLSSEDAPHVKVTADMLRLAHFPSSVNVFPIHKVRHNCV